MARTTVKATYSLSPGIVDRLEQLAKTWQVSKSEALARAIAHAADANPPADPVAEALLALKALHQSATVSEADADAWMQQARAQRLASSRLGDE